VKAPALVGLALILTACATAPRPLPRAAIPDGTGGSSITAQSTAPTDPRERFVGNAVAMVGQPYRWGGAEPGGFDCSGLVVYAAAGAGLSLPRTAAEQQSVGVAIARHELRAGDLVFMHLAHKELHVGIALDGERFVHAPSTGGWVRIDSLALPAYSRGFVQARRIVADAAAR
jgi:cell wall-associated NlpC family hydrolase